jgi:dTDP-4-dehydrorhamnose reductase
MRLLLLGGSAFVGAAVRRQPAWPADARWTYHAHATPDPAAISLNLHDAEQVARVVREVRPTHVLDCAVPAQQDPTAAEQAMRLVCDALRSYAPEVRYVLVSTDAVFSGAAGRFYTEADPVDPCSPYGAAKARAEAVVRETLANAAVARTCVVYGRDWREPAGLPDGRLRDILARLRAGQPVPQYAAQYRTPTYVDDLAPALLQLVAAEARGIFHLAGPVRCSRAELARTAARAFGLDPAGVIDQALPAQPVFGNDVALSIAHTQAVLGWAPRPPAEALAHLAAMLRRDNPAFIPA